MTGAVMARLALRLVALASIAPPLALAQDAPPAPPPAPPKVEAPKPAPPRPATVGEYMGRAIAAPMSFEAGPWLVRQTREKEESCAELLKALKLEAGQSVADVGCGNGFYTFRLAELVGPKGKVHAVDIQPEMLVLLEAEAKRRREADPKLALDHVVPVLGEEKDPHLPEGAIDLAFLVDVYHEFAFPAEMLAALKKSLKPEGRIVLVEFRLEDPEVPIKLEHKMSKAQITKELRANGFELAEEYDRLPWQHVMFFRAARKAPPGEAADPAKPRKSEVPREPAKPR